MYCSCGRLKQDANNSLALPPSCSVGSLWLLARHGTRNPGSKDKQKMETLFPWLRDKIVAAWGAGESGLQSEQVEALRVWRWTKGKEKDNESPLSFSGKFFPKRAKNDVFSLNKIK